MTVGFKFKADFILNFLLSLMNGRFARLPGKVYNNKDETIDVYGSDVEVDYRGYEVTVENFIRVLTGRLPPDTPRSKRLSTDDRSNVLVYMTGHGGEDFLKFQDAEEISNVELADAFEQMWQKRRYHELLFIIDTCQAVSMYGKFYSPNIMSIASSQIGEDSLSHHVDPTIGVYIIDRYTYYLLEFLESTRPGSRKTMAQLFEICPRHQCISSTGVSTHLFRRRPDQTLVTDFFGSVRTVDTSDDFLHISPKSKALERSTDNVPLSRGHFSHVTQFLGDQLDQLKILPQPDKTSLGSKIERAASAAFLLVVVMAIIKSLIG
ncbi:unnamed protein product [Clavelina lepadiformis]|uniref:GPI-anchor transamidase n=1 Tax=Clavelina lepadiformis TaxID=159417 RepID=A0ABP0F567_CLALP